MSCYPHAWESILRAFDKTKGDRVQVPKADLAELVACTGRPAPPGLVLDTGRSYCVAAREPLFRLIVEHGAEPCAKAAA
jgi:hypothetical protein